jgi:hypothetical protein
MLSFLIRWNGRHASLNSRSAYQPGGGVIVVRFFVYNRRRLKIARQIDPLILFSAAVSLYLAIQSNPWWGVSGAMNSKLLTIEVSPYYFRTIATGISSGAPFVPSLGSLTRLLLVLGSVALAASSIRPSFWWRELAVYFSLSALTEVYLSFLLMYHAAETTLLGAYGILPPYSGTSHLPVAIIGLDLNNYAQPLVTAGFNMPFYLGFLSLGLVGCSMILQHLKRRPRASSKGVTAIFTPES